MLLYSFLLLITISVFVAWANWRRGIFMMVLIAAFQDPIRKLAPGTPSYFVLATSPIWFVVVISALTRIPRILANFRRSYHQLSSSMKIFMLALIPAALLSITYGAGSWKFTLLGLFSYGGMLSGWIIGFVYARGERDIKRLMAFFCFVTAIMLTGTLIQYMGLAPAWPAIGTAALETHWIRYTDYGAVDLFAGFYRSPDVMGWHAVMAAMCALTLGIRERKVSRLFWFLVAAWAIGAAMLCGRRKMILMLPLFGIIFSWIYWRAKTATKAVAVAGTLVVIFFAGYMLYSELSPDEGIEQYYVHYLGDAPARAKAHGIDSVIETYRQSGFFGNGLGFAVQGQQNLEANKPRIWQEGGLEKILVELGVPGFLAFFLLASALIRAILKIVFYHLSPRSSEFAIFAGVAAMVIANAGSFIVSHQIFGDPFIMTFYSFLTGLVLSAGRAKEDSGPSKIIDPLGSEKQKYATRAAALRRQSLPGNRR